MTDYTSGRVTVPVIPTVSGIQGTIGKEFAKVKPTVTASVKVDTRGLSEVGKAKLDADDKALQAKLEAARQGLAKLQAQKTSPEIDAKITAATAKLDQLRAGLRDLEAKPSSPKVDADVAAAKSKIAQVEGQIQRLNAEKASPKLDADIAAGESKVKALEAEVKSFAERRAVAEVSVQDDGQSESRIGGLFDRIKGKAATLGPAFAAAGLVAGAALVGAISMTMDLSDARARLTAQLGLTPAESERYGRLAGQVYSNAYGESLDQVNEALASITRNIGNTAAMSDADLQGVTGTVLNLASTFDVDLNEATRAVGTMMKTGMAPDAKSALDIITVGLQNGTNVAGDLFDTFSEYSTQFRKLGLDGTTATGLLSQGLKAGARDADTVADALKEFSIRAIDGSKSTAAGFDAVGLKADDMASKIAAGGPAAQQALGLTLDRLRAIEDPVARDAAAVQLFGTKAEDLGAALYALDPTAAAQGLGEVTGAGDKMNQTLGETASSRIETFKRSLQTGIVDFIGGVVLPPLMALGDFGAKLFGPAWDGVRSFLGFLAGTGGVIAGVILAIAAAVKLWAFATTTLNFAFLSSPITWIIIGIVALVAAVIYAWNHFEGFRNVVLTVFSAIWTAVQAVGSFFVSVWDGVVTAVQAVGNWFSWLWNTILSPVFSAIATGVKILVAIVLTVLITPIVVAVRLLAALFTWWWQNVTWPILQAIGSGASWLWNNVLSPVFAAIGVGIQAVASVFTWWWQNVVMPVVNGIAALATWLWYNALLPVWNAIQAGIQFLAGVFTWWYQNVIQPVFNAVAVAASYLWAGLQVVFGYIQVGLNVVGSFFGWVYATLIKPALDGIGAAASFVWNNVLAPVFETFKRGINAVGDAFQFVSDWIGRAWESIKEKARGPIQWVIDIVYNNGIRSVWNSIAGIFGMDDKKLPEYHLAGGGVLPGYTPGRDSVLAMLSPGEGVLVPEAVRGLGAGFVGWANRYFSGGRSPGGLNTGGGGSAPSDGLPGFDLGGIVAGVTGFVSDTASFTADLFTKGPTEAVKGVFAKVLGERFPGAGSQWLDAAMGIPPRTVDAVIDVAKKWVEDAKNSIGGFFGGVAAQGQLASWIATAMAITGVPATWAIPLHTLIMRESGGNPSAINLWDSNAQAGHPSQGLMQTIPGTFAAYRDPRLPNVITDPIANIVAGIRYILARYGSIFSVQQAVGATPKGYDSGGWLPPGETLAVNATGRPEAVLTARQWSSVEANLSGGDGAGVFEGDLYLDSGEFLGAVRGVVRAEGDDLGSSLARGRRG